MTLSSPRFKKLNASRLYKLGSSGHSVHLLQQALYDAGHTFSRADGLFGPQTEKSVREFQKQNRLTVDGILGKKTRESLDQRFPTFDYRVRLHFRSINLTRVPFNKIWESTKSVYAQYGINVEMSSGQSLSLTSEQTSKFFTVTGSCNWIINSGEYHELHGLGGKVKSTEILVYYVNKFSEANLLGCGGHATNRPAATLASNASQWDTAHEVGHVLLTSGFTPVHSTSLNNLMHATASSYSNTPRLTTEQIVQMRKHACCKEITSC